MGKTVKINFEKARRRRQFFQRAKRFLVVGIIMLAVIAAMAINNFLVENGVSIHLSDTVESFGGAGYPTDLPGGIIHDVKSLGKNMAVLNDTNLYIYSPKARIISNTQEMSDSTILTTTGSRLITYNIGSKRYRINSASQNLLDKETEDSILAADMGENGEYAIVTSPMRFVAMITVYSNKFEPIFYSYSAENHITGVSLSPNGNMMVTSGINTSNGMLISVITYYHFASDEPVASLTLEDALILNMDFYENGSVGILTDHEYIVTDVFGHIVSTYTLPDGNVTSFRRYKGETAITIENKETRRETLILLNSKCEEQWHLTMDGKMRDVAIGPKKVYVLDNSGIFVYNRSQELIGQLDMSGITRIHAAENTLYYFTQSEIAIMED